MKYLFVFVMLLITLITCNLYAIDSLKIYKLGEVNIISKHNIDQNFNPTTNYHQIQNKDATSIDELREILPSFNLQTNSRGENIFTYRGSQERQTHFYLDGVLLSLPWDGRADLDLLVPSIIGKIEFQPLSVLYGANNMMGIAAVSTFERIENGFGGTFRTAAGDGGMKNVEIVHDGRINNFNYIAAVNWLDSDGEIASQKTPGGLQNYDYNSALVPNTFSERFNLYGKGEFRGSENFAIGISANYSDYDKGVIPEENKAPNKARFWKYNDNRRLILTLNSDWQTSAKNILRFTYWFDKFNQNIEDYTDFSYKTQKGSEISEDFTHGFRVINLYDFSPENSLALAANVLLTKHNETIENLIEYVMPQDAEFSQNLFSLSGEYKHHIFNRFTAKVGAEFDYSITPKTGLFTEANGTEDSDFGVITGVNYLAAENSNFFLNFSRKVRFPALREMYSAALGKFKVNPNLKAEDNVLVEIGYSLNLDDFSLQATGFSNNYNNMIMKAIDIESGLEMRDNLMKANILGLELITNYHFLRYFDWNFNFTYMYSTGNDGLQDVAHLDYRPDIMFGTTLLFNSNLGIKSQLEIDYIGQQFALAGDNIYDELAPTCFVNLRLAYNFLLHNSLFELYARVNNLFDVYRQLKTGIPAFGRTFQTGILFKM